MDGIDRTRRRTLDVPAKPETGLAEWTSKIKALQRQVDEDEEAEHRRLEQEITASRMARMRRSTGAGSRGSSLDLSQEDVAALKNVGGRTPDVGHTRQQIQEDAMKKLTGQDSDISHPILHRTSAPPSGTSLAAFMGGKATGPRLTRHEPQQNAHDPTQFEQRTHVTNPHPVFGRGGVAMPGMTAYTGTNNESFSRSARESAYSSTSPDVEQYSQRDRTSSTPSGVRSVVAKAEERRAAASQPVGSTYERVDNARLRTMSTPTGLAPQKSSTTPLSKVEDSHAGRYSPRSVSRSPAPPAANVSVRPTTPHERQKPYEGTPSPQPLASRSPAPPTMNVTLRPTTPQERQKPVETPSTQASYSAQLPRSPTFSSPRQSSPSVSRSQNSTPSLSRAILPEPRLPSGGPQFATSPVPSNAFLRAPAEKEPTPSISRLQGRGFVQSVVKASGQLSTSPSGSASPVSRQTAVTPEGGRKAVMDRWQFENGKGGSTLPPPIISPKPIPMRKSRTFDPVQSPSASSSPVPTPFLSDASNKYLKLKPSLPSISQPTTPEPTSSRQSFSKSKSDVGVIPPSTHPKTPAGSSSTLISYIKPVKTGDGPAIPTTPTTPAPQSKSATPAVDELGVRVRTRSKSFGAGDLGETEQGQSRTPSANLDRDVGKPLSHPTKERAKKPRKAGVTKESSLGGSHHELAKASASPSQSSLHRDSPTSTPTSVSFSRQQVPREPTSTLPSPPSSGRSPTPSRHVETHQPHTESPLPPTEVASAPVHYQQLLQRGSDISPTPSPGVERHVEKPTRDPRSKKHVRIPSTGTRATVMDVAQALQDHEQHVREHSDSVARSSTSPLIPPEKLEAHTPATTDLPSLNPEEMARSIGDRSGTVSPTRMEQRKSSYDKYSAFMMPSLKEETTPTPSPAGSLTRGTVNPVETLHTSVRDVPQTTTNKATRFSVPLEPVHVPVSKDAEVFLNRVHDGPLPRVDIDALLTPDARTDTSDVQSISVDVMSIIGTTSTTVKTEQNIFYDNELLVIVHRSKVKSSGLVVTTVWSWFGKKNTRGEREERKVQELARRYNTTLIPVKQYDEPLKLVNVLGGQLAIRQGTRAHWSRENTAMHIVHYSNGVIFIDEIELGSPNLCSGFSYCISLLETFYVWHGRGSTPAEKKAALEYAQSLATAASAVVELTEGDNDDDEMFWMMLGDRDYPQANHWKWKASMSNPGPRIWRLNDGPPTTFHPIISLLAEASPDEHVYLVDCELEYYVLVGKEARGRRRTIRLALSVASVISSRTKQLKPFASPVHVLIFPSQIPGDLRLTFRDLNDLDTKQEPYPDHMNLLSADEAQEQLNQTSWDRKVLKDSTMLPMGIHPSDL